MDERTILANLNDNDSLVACEHIAETKSNLELLHDMDQFGRQYRQFVLLTDKESGAVGMLNLAMSDLVVLCLSNPINYDDFKRMLPTIQGEMDVLRRVWH